MLHRVAVVVATPILINLRTRWWMHQAAHRGAETCAPSAVVAVVIRSAMPSPDGCLWAVVVVLVMAMMVPRVRGAGGGIVYLIAQSVVGGGSIYANGQTGSQGAVRLWMARAAVVLAVR